MAISIFSWLFSLASRAASLYSANFSANWTQRTHINGVLNSYNVGKLISVYYILNRHTCARTHTHRSLCDRLAIKLPMRVDAGKSSHLPTMPQQKHELTRSVFATCVLHRHTNTHKKSKHRDSGPGALWCLPRCVLFPRHSGWKEAKFALWRYFSREREKTNATGPQQ